LSNGDRRQGFAPNKVIFFPSMLTDKRRIPL
jgi:hypothetical protein